MVSAPPPKRRSLSKPPEPMRVPLYRTIADTVIRDIRRGRYVEGARLPPSRDLATQLEVNRATVHQALQLLKASGGLSARQLTIRFRASAHDDMLGQLASQYGVQDFIELSPAVPYREALAEMLSVDALLVLQASNCNAQIPAKIYEYLRAGRPILGLTDPAGDTAGVLRGAGVEAMARIDSADEIAVVLPRFVAAVRTQTVRLPDPLAVKNASRQGRSQAFAEMLNGVLR